MSALLFLERLACQPQPTPAHLLPLAIYLRGESYTSRAVDGVLAWVAAGRDVRECPWCDPEDVGAIEELLAGHAS